MSSNEDLPILFHKIDPPQQFPEFQAELLRIGGTTPDGRPRLLLEWGGWATRWFGDKQVAKLPMRMWKEQVGWTFLIEDPKTNKAHLVDVDELDLDMIPLTIRQRPDGTMRVPVGRHAYIDYPWPNYFISDWQSPEKMMPGHVPALGPAPRQGDYYPILKIHNPADVELLCYRHPDGQDLDMVRAYQREKEQDFMTMGKHFDAALSGSDVQRINNWKTRALAHMAQEDKAARVEGHFDYLKTQLERNGRTYYPMPIKRFGEEHNV